MSAEISRCEPPPNARQYAWHWLKNPLSRPIIAQWHEVYAASNPWEIDGDFFTVEQVEEHGWQYGAAAVPPEGLGPSPSAA